MRLCFRFEHTDSVLREIEQKFNIHLLLPYLSSRRRIQFYATFDTSNACTIPNAQQLPLQPNAARQTPRFVGDEHSSGVPKCNITVGVFDAFSTENI
jgi:hypothetical protein